MNEEEYTITGEIPAVWWIPKGSWLNRLWYNPISQMRSVAMYRKYQSKAGTGRNGKLSNWTPDRIAKNMKSSMPEIAEFSVGILLGIMMSSINRIDPYRSPGMLEYNDMQALIWGPQNLMFGLAAVGLATMGDTAKRLHNMASRGNPGSLMTTPMSDAQIFFSECLLAHVSTIRLFLIFPLFFIGIGYAYILELSPALRAWFPALIDQMSFFGNVWGYLGVLICIGISWLLMTVYFGLLIGLTGMKSPPVVSIPLSIFITILTFILGRFVSIGLVSIVYTNYVDPFGFYSLFHFGELAYNNHIPFMLTFPVFAIFMGLLTFAVGWLGVKAFSRIRRRI